MKNNSWEVSVFHTGFSTKIAQPCKYHKFIVCHQTQDKRHDKAQWERKSPEDGKSMKNDRDLAQ